MIGVYAFNNFDKRSAQSYYRVEIVLKALNELGLAKVWADDGKGSERTRDLAMQAMIGSDIVFSWNTSTPEGLRTAQDFASYKPVLQDKQLLVPPAYVFDMDDGVEFVPPLHGTYAYFGVRNWDGTVLKPGDKVIVPGTDKVLWEDKVTPGQQGEIFDIERNLQSIQLHYEIARTARGVTVTTPELANLYRENGVKNVHVFPNSIWEPDLLNLNLQPHKGVRILWQGSDSHFADWLPVAEALGEVLRENPHVTMVIYGATWPWLKRVIPAAQFEYHEWSDYSSYQIKRQTLDIDINLCPLAESPFNSCKSALKFYEASSHTRPEATLAANVGPYKEIEHGKTGLLYNSSQEFKEQLTALIKNQELRLSLASRAKEWVRTHRSARKTVMELYEFYEGLKKEQRMEALAS